MSLPFHLVSSLEGVRAGDEVTVEGDEAHHAVAVRRLRVGEQVVLTDGRGATARGEVSATGRRVFTVTVAEVADTPEPDVTVTVVQALPKGDRGELAVEVLTEVGVSRIVPWAASRSVAVWKGERAVRSRAKWQATAREAAKQARRPWVPEVTELVPTAGLAEALDGHEPVLVLHEDATLPLGAVAVPERGRVAVVVGPEGGISPEELAELERLGAVVVRLGPEVLRTSTAGVAAVAALMSRTRHWS